MASDQANIGGYDCKWVEDPPDELKCQICLTVARDPHQHGDSQCGKVFCQSCVTEQMKHNTTCPNCRQPLTTFQDARSSRQIKALKVKCDNYKGCQWVGELGSLEEHLQICSHTLLPCTNQCKNNDQIVKVLRKDFQNHLAKKCPRRQYECSLCKERGEYQEMKAIHNQTCPKVKVRCPRDKCQFIIFRYELASHLLFCDYEPVLCKYVEVGCTETPPRKDLKKHEKDAQLHLTMTAEAVLGLKKMVAALEEELEQEKCIRKLETSLKAVTVPTPPCTFKLTKFLARKSHNDIFHSAPFYTSHTGYKMCISVYPNGTDSGEGSHVSVGACLMRGDNDDSLTWPFTGTVTFELLNQLEDRNHRKRLITFSEAGNVVRKRVVNDEKGLGWGSRLFISNADLDYKPDKNCQYLKDDTLIFRVSVQVPDYKPWLECTI